MKKFWNGHNQPKIPERIAEAKTDKLTLEKQVCPNCSKPRLYAVSVERGIEGWETKFWCDNCRTNGVLNNTGFHVELTKKEATEAK